MDLKGVIRPQYTKVRIHDTSCIFKVLHSGKTSGVECMQSPWKAHTVGRRRPWYSIIAHGQHTCLGKVKHGMFSWTFDSTHDRTMFVMACHHLPLDYTHKQTTLVVAFPRRPWKAHTIRRCHAWHSIMAFDNTHGRTMT